MIQAYPYTLTVVEDGAVMVQFVDIPGAVTYGDNEAEAIRSASDALLVTLTGYVDLNKAAPLPSSQQPGQRVAHLPLMAALKLAIYQAMHRQCLSRYGLAQLMGCDEKQVRRILDLDHSSKVGQIELAARALRLQLAVDVQDREAVAS